MNIGCARATELRARSFHHSDFSVYSAILSSMGEDEKESVSVAAWERERQMIKCKIEFTWNYTDKLAIASTHTYIHTHTRIYCRDTIWNFFYRWCIKIRSICAHPNGTTININRNAFSTFTRWHANSLCVFVYVCLCELGYVKKGQIPFLYDSIFCDHNTNVIAASTAFSAISLKFNILIVHFSLRMYIWFSNKKNLNQFIPICV